MAAGAGLGIVVLVFPGSSTFPGMMSVLHPGLSSDVLSGSAHKLQQQVGVVKGGGTAGRASQSSQSAPDRGGPGVSIVTRGVGVSSGGVGGRRSQDPHGHGVPSQNGGTTQSGITTPLSHRAIQPGTAAWNSCHVIWHSTASWNSHQGCACCWSAACWCSTGCRHTTYMQSSASYGLAAHRGCACLWCWHPTSCWVTVPSSAARWGHTMWLGCTIQLPASHLGLTCCPPLCRLLGLRHICCMYLP